MGAEKAAGGHRSLPADSVGKHLRAAVSAVEGAVMELLWSLWSPPRKLIGPVVF